MEIVLYTNTASDDHLTPTLSNDLTFSDCVIKHEADIDTPILEIQTTTNLAGYNYAKIARYGRYYWIKPRTVANGLWEISCESDPLVSLKSDILNVTGTVNRAERLYNGYLNDPNYIALAPTEYTFKSFPYGMDDNALILMTVG